jgi:hypothetical protein
MLLRAEDDGVVVVTVIVTVGAGGGEEMKKRQPSNKVEAAFSRKIPSQWAKRGKKTKGAKNSGHRTKRAN